MEQQKRQIVPRYAYIPLISAVVLNFAVYIFANLIASDFKHYDFTIWVDGLIPFVPFFITFYVLAYVQWVTGYIMIARESKEMCYKAVSADIIAKLMCFVFYIALPTTMVRAEITGTGLLESLTRLIYTVDTPTNLFPSIHCLESWVCLRFAIGMKKAPKWYKYVMLFFTVGVFMSVVFVKQHVVVDIPAGILVFEIGLLIVKRSGIDRLFYRTELADKLVE